MHMEVKYLIMILSAILIFGGLYFKFLYDVPDGQDLTNMWVSWTLVVFGVSGIIASSLWKKRNPLAVEEEDLNDEDIGLSGIKDRSKDNDDDYGARSVDT